MRHALLWGVWTLLFWTGTALGDLRVMVGVDPSDQEAMLINLLDMRSSLAKATGQPVSAIKSQDLGDVMRSTRTGEYDVYIAPAHVAASALAHGYELIGSTDRDEVYQLVGRAGIKAPADLKSGKIYLTQQDSVGAYMARGMLNESGQSLKMFRQVFYRSTSGAGASDAEARRNAICEALERYSGVFRDGDSSCRATLRELGETAIHPNDVMGFSAAQFSGRQAWNDQHSHPALRIPESFDEDLACNWTAIRHVASGELAWLPTALCYFGTPDSEVRRACRAESNGCAAGATYDDALVRGFLELVERDAVGLWWHNRIPRSGIALDTITDSYVRAVADLYERLGRSLRILYLQSDLEIPVFAAISARAGTDDEQLTIGFGASFEPSAALRHAVTELNLFLPEVAAGHRRALVCGPEPSGEYLHPISLLPWSAGARDSSRGVEVRRGREVDWVIHLARQHGLRVFALDQTRADVGLPTVRVIVPGLCHFWRRLAPSRLYSVPVRMGWLNEPRREDELNPSCLLV